MTTTFHPPVRGRLLGAIGTAAILAAGCGDGDSADAPSDEFFEMVHADLVDVGMDGAQADCLVAALRAVPITADDAADYEANGDFSDELAETMADDIADCAG